jgi:hypothetical protein
MVSNVGGSLMGRTMGGVVDDAIELIPAKQ